MMTNTGKRSLVTPIAILVIAGIALVGQFQASTSAAQDLTNPIKANIPFAFIMGTTVLPAGPYIAERSSQGVVRLRNTDNWKSVVSLVSGDQLKRDIQRPQLVFHRYGDKYFIAKIWDGRSDTAYQFPKSKAEREAARTPGDKLANATTTPEIVAITAGPAS
jgi:hypothetical protein